MELSALPLHRRALPFAPVVQEVRDALVVPQTALGRNGRRFNGGVYEAGRPVPLALHAGWGGRNLPDVPPAHEASLHLPGSYLFGGWLRDHFGHFLSESLGRLWAYPEHAEEIAGIVYILRELAPLPAPRPASSLHGRRLLLPYVTGVLDCLGVTAPRVSVGPAVSVDRLLVPAQLLFTAEDAGAGHPAFNEFARRAAAHPAVVAGPKAERIYVSRRRFTQQVRRASGFLLEDAIERNLEAEGYTVIHPETLPIHEQLSYYVGARQLVFAESSAVFLAAMVLGPEQEVAMIHRRDPCPAPLIARLAGSGARRVLHVPAVSGFVAAAPGDMPKGKAWLVARPVLDLRRVEAMLAEAGFATRRWEMPGEAELAAAVEAAVAELQGVFPGVAFGLRDAAV